MVKIFVGNLTPAVTAEELKKLFEQHGKVSECDVIRNYAFVHMDDEEEAKKAFDALNNYDLAGRALHLEYSTSKLRKAPGMEDVCFRCGAKDHKTTNCPVHDGTKAGAGAGAGGGGGGNKRSGPKNDRRPPKQRRHNNDFWYGNRNYDGGNFGGGGYGGRFSPPMPRGGMFGDYYSRGDGFGNGSLGDPIIPRPPDRLLMPLYEDYLDSRERYYYFRDRLERELYAMRRGAIPPVAPAPPPPSARTGGSGYGSLMSSLAGSIAASSTAAGLDLAYGRQSRSPSSIVRYPELYYAHAAASGNQTSPYDLYSSQSQSVGGGGASSLPENHSLFDRYTFNVD